MLRFSLCLAVLGLTTLAHAATFTSTKNGYSITAPSGWKQTPYPGPDAIFLAPKALPTFQPNVNTMSQLLPIGITLKQYHDVSLNRMKGVISGAKVMSTRATTLGGMPAYETKIQGKKGQLNLFFDAIYTVNNRRGYVITGTTLLNQQTAFQPVMKQFKTGFKFTR